MISRRNNTSHNSSQSLAIIIVAYGNENTMAALLERIGKEKRAGDQVVVIDNHPEHGSAVIAESADCVDVLVRSENIGFAAGCNLGVSVLPSKTELILFLNPDVMPKKGALTKLRTGGRKEWSGWMGLLTLPNGTINSAGNVIHMSGLSWCSAYGQPVESITQKKEVDILSGACLLIRTEAWEQVGGFAEEYYMYYEDTDLSMTMRRQGMKLGLVPDAHFEHDYDFQKSSLKWFYIERNRYLIIWRQWPLLCIILFLPFFMVIEAGLWAVSILQRRFWLRMRAVFSFVSILPANFAQRGRLQSSMKMGPKIFMQSLQSRLSTPLLGRVGSSATVNSLMSAYYHGVYFILKLFTRS